MFSHNWKWHPAREMSFLLWLVVMAPFLEREDAKGGEEADSVADTLIWKCLLQAMDSEGLLSMRCSSRCGCSLLRRAESSGCISCTKESDKEMAER